MVTFLKLWCLLHLIKSSASYSCNITFNENSKSESNSNTISAYNDVLGPIINLTYDDPALLYSVQQLYATFLRHPGGTVANYWNMTNASYVSPCNTSHYHYCQWQDRINKLPQQTFSPSNFSQNIGKLIDDNIIYVLNVFTLYGEEMIDQLNLLYDEIGESKINYLELGNELSLNGYKWQFPNSTVYIKKILPLISTARSLFPRAKLGIVTAISLPGVKNDWNDQLKPFTKYIDAVTIHDYTLSQTMINNDNPNYLNNWDDERSYISSYAMSVIPQYIQYINDTFGQDVNIWMTEYDVGIGDTAFGKNASFMYSNLHAMYSLGYIIAATCEGSNKLEMMLHTMWSEQQGTNWYPRQATNYNPAMSNDINNASFDIIAQTRAQLSYIATVKNDQQFCLNVNTENDDQCPLNDIQIVGKKNMDCVYGIGFKNSSNQNSFGFLISNSCKMVIDLSIDLANGGNGAQDTMTDIWEYDSNDTGGANAKYVDCMGDGNVWDESCAAIKAKYSQVKVANTDDISITIQPLSFILAASV